MTTPAVDRRQFARQLAAASLAAAPLGLTAVSAQADDANPQQPPEAEKPREPVDIALDLVRRLYPHDFDEEQLAALRHDIEEDQARSKILSSFALTNADEPAPIFAAWRAEG